MSTEGTQFVGLAVGIDATTAKTGAQEFTAAKQSIESDLNALKTSLKAPIGSVEWQNQVNEVRAYTKAIKELTTAESERQFLLKNTAGLSGSRTDIIAGAAARIKAEQDAAKASQLAMRETKAATQEAVAAIKAGVSEISNSFTQLKTLLVGLLIEETIRRSTKAWGEFQTALINTKNLGGGTDAEMSALGDDILGLSLKIPVATKELQKMAEEAARMGYAGEAAIAKFIETAGKMETVIGKSGGDRTSSLTRLLRITGEDIGDVDKLASAFLKLRSEAGASDTEIFNFVHQLEGAAPLLKLNAAEVMAFSAEITELGIGARSGQALTVLFIAMGEALTGDFKKMEALKEITGKTESELKNLFEANPGEGLLSFFDGVARMQNAGESLYRPLKELGVSSALINKDVNDLGRNVGELRKKFADVNSEMKGTVELNKQSASATKSFESQMQLLGNELTRLKIEVGRDFAPMVIDSLRTATDLLKSFLGHSNEIQGNAAEIKFLRDAIIGVGIAFATWKVLLIAGQLIQLRNAVIASTSSMELMKLAVEGNIVSLGRVTVAARAAMAALAAVNPAVWIALAATGIAIGAVKLMEYEAAQEKVLSNEEKLNIAMGDYSRVMRDGVKASVDDVKKSLVELQDETIKAQKKLDDLRGYKIPKEDKSTRPPVDSMGFQASGLTEPTDSGPYSTTFKHPGNDPGFKMNASIAELQATAAALKKVTDAKANLEQLNNTLNQTVQEFHGLDKYSDVAGKAAKAAMKEITDYVDRLSLNSKKVAEFTHNEEMLNKALKAGAISLDDYTDQLRKNYSATYGITVELDQDVRKKFEQTHKFYDELLAQNIISYKEYVLKIKELQASLAPSLTNPTKKDKETSRPYSDKSTLELNTYVDDWKKSEIERKLATAEVNQRIKENTLGTLEAMELGFRQAAKGWGNTSQKMMEIGSTIADSLKTNIAQGLTDIVTGSKTASQAFKEMASSIVNDIIRIVIEKEIELAIDMAIDALSNMGGGGGKSFSGNANFTGGSTMIAHSGGDFGFDRMQTRAVDMSVFQNAPRFHSGTGLASNEVPSVLTDDESVLTPGQMRYMGAGSQRKSKPMEVHVHNINVTDMNMVDQHILQNPNTVLSVLAKNPRAVKQILHLNG